MSDLPEDIVRDIAAIARIDAVPSLLRVICQTTGMGFAAVARVTDGSWTACAVQDEIAFGLPAGGQLEIGSTLCRESRAALKPIAIDHVAIDPVYRDHDTPRIYGFQSYISVPIVLADGSYFGNLCAIDPKPAKVSDDRTVNLFTLFAELIAVHLESDRKRQVDQSALLDERATGELREQFIAVLGHDLRTPLAAVSALTQLLQRQSDEPAKVLTIAQRIATNTRRMAALIDDVLDFARGRLGGGFGVELAEVPDLAGALHDVVDELRDTHPQRTLEAAIDIRGSVRCDRGRLQQLVANLLGNALSHGSPTAPVRFTASTEADAVVLAVHNHGEPIPPHSLRQVFSPFWRRSTAGARDGLGLGLFICAQIVSAHRGTLEVSSSADDGTRFVVRLPIESAVAG